MATADDKATRTFKQMLELQEFGFALAASMGQFKGGQKNILPALRELDISVPEFLGEGDIEFLDEAPGTAVQPDETAISFVGPGDPNALGVTIGCVRRPGQKWRYCLECSWFSCRVVIVLDPIIVVTPVP